MFPTIYFEKEIENHPRTKRMFDRFPETVRVPLDNYGEVFNRKSQNFRLQKQKPSLILAKKFKNWLVPTPKGYGIGGTYNFYFSHMLNCLFDCRYCFLQGMYASAHYVLFINYEEFMVSIEEKIKELSNETPYFFSGYDCDSLAMEPLSHFVEEFLPFFSKHPQAFLELRTKSIQIHSLIKNEALPNCIVAFSLTPEAISRALENKTPPLKKRIEAMVKLQERGWPLGLRFDPLIYCDDFQKQYEELFETVFSCIKVERLHSVTLGPFRLPRAIFKNIRQLYPEEKLFSHSLDEKEALVSYKKEKEEALVHFCTQKLLTLIPSTIFYPMK